MRGVNTRQLEQLAQRLLDGTLALDEFVRTLARPATADLDEAQIDLDRQRRCGYPEVVYGEGKSVATLEKIFRRLMAEKLDVLATRISAEQAAALAPVFPTARYNAVGRTLSRSSRIKVRSWLPSASIIASWANRHRRRVRRGAIACRPLSRCVVGPCHRRLSGVERCLRSGRTRSERDARAEDRTRSRI